jgi:hypothetical protein
MAAARRSRWGGTWRRGEEMRTTGICCGGGGWGWGPFYRFWEGEAGGQQCWGFNSRPFRGAKGGGEPMGAELVQKSEGGRAALRCGSIRVREGTHRWHATQRCGRMGGGGLGIHRRDKGPGWADAGPQRSGGPERFGGLKGVVGP